MENHEEKYEKALSVAKKWHTDGVDDVKRVIECIFPELRESEDEKIRKELIDYFWKKKIYYESEDVKMADSLQCKFAKDSISWLERQGEQKPSWSEEDKNDLFFTDEKEELTEFEKAISEFIQKLTFNGNVLPSKDIKGYAKSLLDLARKELEANYYTKVLDDRMVFKSELHATDLQTAYGMGKQDALKDLPKWKKATEHKDLEKHIAILEEDKVLLSNYLEEGDCYIDLEDLKALPKEE